MEWNLKGHVLVACNCDWGCPCNFNARPTAGKCEGGWTRPTIHGPFPASYDFVVDGVNTKLKAGEVA